MGKVIPIHPVPDDGEIAEYLSRLYMIDAEELDKLDKELKEAQEEAELKGYPTNFAYGQLLNKLRTLKKEEIVHMLAAAMWDQQAGIISDRT